MSITDELRKWGYGFCGDTHDVVTAIADRIDAEHQKACDDAWSNGYESDYLGIEKWLTEHPQAMEHHGWVRLPKDADGEYIHVGDELCGYGWQDGGMYCKAIVNELMILVGTADQKYSDWIMWDAEDTRHYHAPTVEDLLREFALKVAGEDCMTMRTGVVEEYAAKLRLAGDDS